MPRALYYYRQPPHPARGPVSMDELVDMARNNELMLDFEIMRVGEEWTMARGFPEILAAFNDPPRAGGKPEHKASGVAQFFWALSAISGVSGFLAAFLACGNIGHSAASMLLMETSAGLFIMMFCAASVAVLADRKPVVVEPAPQYMFVQVNPPASQSARDHNSRPSSQISDEPIDVSFKPIKRITRSVDTSTGKGPRPGNNGD